MANGQPFRNVVGDAALETVASGHGFLGGPVWHPYEKWLVFSDIPNNRMHRRDATGRIDCVRDPSRMANGNTLDRDGRLLSCEHAASRVTRAEVDGTTTVPVPDHNEVKIGTLRSIIRQSGVARSEFES